MIRPLYVVLVFSAFVLGFISGRYRGEPLPAFSELKPVAQSANAGANGSSKESIDNATHGVECTTGGVPGVCPPGIPDITVLIPGGMAEEGGFEPGKVRHSIPVAAIGPGSENRSPLVKGMLEGTGDSTPPPAQLSVEDLKRELEASITDSETSPEDVQAMAEGLFNATARFNNR